MTKTKKATLKKGGVTVEFDKADVFNALDTFVDIKGFALLMGGITINAATKLVHSETVRPFLRQLVEGGKLWINYSAYQRYVNTMCLKHPPEDERDGWCRTV